TFTWTIRDNLPPTVTGPDDQTNAEEDVVSVPVTATDPDDSVTSYDASGLPMGLSRTTCRGEISGTADQRAYEDGSCPHWDGSFFVSSYAVSVTATDEQGSTSTPHSSTWTIDVANEPPTVTGPGDQDDTEGDTVSGVSVTATDPDDSISSYSASGLPM